MSRLFALDAYSMYPNLRSLATHDGYIASYGSIERARDAVHAYFTKPMVKTFGHQTIVKISHAAAAVPDEFYGYPPEGMKDREVVRLDPSTGFGRYVDLEAPITLAGTDRWVACSAAEFGHPGTVRHIAARGAVTTVCSTTALPAQIWRGNTTKPKCRACVARYASKENR